MARKQMRKLYIGQWIAFLGKRQKDVAKAAGIERPYMSQLASGKKFRPTLPVLSDIAKFLEISIEDLHHPPPKAADVQAAKELTPSDLATLGQLLKRVAKQKTL